MDEFYKTRMGQTFYEHTMPELVKQLARLNENLERLARKQDQPRRTNSHALPFSSHVDRR